MSTINNIMGSIPPSELRTGYLYLVTNEEDTKCLKELAETPAMGNAMMGVGVMCLLNMASIRGSLAGAGPQIEHIIAFDYNVVVQSFWQQMEPLLKSATDRIDALAKIKDLLSKRRVEYFGEGSTNFEHLEKEVALGKSYLSTDERFEKIQKIFTSNQFYFAPLDLFDSEKFGGLHRELKQRDITIDTMYISNIMMLERCINRVQVPTRLDQCMKSLTHILSDSSRIVYAEQYDTSCPNRPVPTDKRTQQKNDSFSWLQKCPTDLHKKIDPPLLKKD
jgi:hypothetical protein